MGEAAVPTGPNEKPLPVPAEGRSLAPNAKPDGAAANSAGVGAVPDPAGGGGPSRAFVSKVVPTPNACETPKLGEEPNEKMAVDVAGLATLGADPDPPCAGANDLNGNGQGPRGAAA